MKQFYLFVLLTVMTSITFAQSIQVSYEDSVIANGDTISVNGVPSAVKTVDFHVKNISSGSINVRVVKDELSLPTGMTYFFCFDVCYNPSQTTSSAVAIDANTTYYSPLECELLPDGNSGDALVKMTVKNDADDNDAVVFYVSYHMDATGIVSNNSVFSVYPNPAHDFLSVDTKNITHASYEIFNELGSLVYSGIVSQQSIDVSNLDKGLYLVRVMNNNTVLGTRRVIIQ